jgi:hypothetical protein
MRNIVLASALALSIVAPAHAQDAAKEAALTRFIEAVGANQSYNIIGQQALMAFAPLINMNRARQQDAIKIVEGEVVPVLNSNRATYTRALRAAYSKRFTTAELTQGAAFMESALGRKMTQANQEVIAEAAGSLKPLQTQITNQVAPRVISKMRAAGLTVPQEAPARK